MGARHHPLRAGRTPRRPRARFDVSSSLDPKNGTAHLMLALCEYQLDARRQRDGAHPDGEEARGPEGRRPAATCSTYHEGMLLLRAGRYERALETLQPLVSAGVEDENLELALGMGVLLMRPKEAPAEGVAGARASSCAPAAPSVTTWPRRSRRAKREYVALVAGSAGVSQRALRLRALPARAPRISIAGSHEFLKEIEDQSGARARPHAGGRGALPGRFGSRPPVRAGGREARAATIRSATTCSACSTSIPATSARAIPELEAAARMVPGEAQFQFALGNAYARAGRADRGRAGARGLRRACSKNGSRPSRAAGDDAAAPGPRLRRTRPPPQKLNLACSSTVRPASPSCASPKCSFRMSAWMFFRLILLNRL